MRAADAVWAWAPRASRGPADSSSQAPPVHHLQRLADQFDLNAVRVLEVDRVVRASVRAEVLDPLLLQALLDGLEIVGVDGDGDVLDTSQSLDAGLQTQARKVEEGQQVVVA